MTDFGSDIKTKVGFGSKYEFKPNDVPPPGYYQPDETQTKTKSPVVDFSSQSGRYKQGGDPIYGSKSQKNFSSYNPYTPSKRNLNLSAKGSISSNIGTFKTKSKSVTNIANKFNKGSTANPFFNRTIVQDQQSATLAEMISSLEAKSKNSTRASGNAKKTSEPQYEEYEVVQEVKLVDEE